MQKFKIRSGDEVLVISGAEKGKSGKVLRVLPDKSKVIVSGVNIATKHKKPSSANEGGIVASEMPIHISNVALIDPETGKPAKVKFLMDGDSKVRVSKKSGKQINFVRG